MIPGLDERMQRFRIASRELYNNFFAVPDPWRNDGWIMAERFADVEQVLFRRLVFEPTPEGLSQGCAHFDVELAIQVVLTTPFCPIMINRAIDSPYWDHPIKEITQEARLLYIEFFDWDELSFRNNQYVRVRIQQWDAHPGTVGSQALVEARHVRYAKA